MTRPKRYFPVSHDILTDPEMLTLLDDLGERFWRFWMWVLSRTDRAENSYQIMTKKSLENDWKMVGIYPKSGWKMVEKCLDYGWIVVEKPSENDFPIILHTRNYRKYHKSHAPSQKQSGSHDGALLTNLTNLTNLTPYKSPTNGAAVEMFWETYPKKKGKGNVEKWFTRNHPDADLLQRIIAKVERLKASHDWTKDQGKYIPHPATWLNAKGWEDEVQHATAAAAFVPPPFPPKSDPIARGQWREAYGDPSKWGYR